MYIYRQKLFLQSHAIVSYITISLILPQVTTSSNESLFRTKNYTI
jgi:hypothetical protein